MHSKTKELGACGGNFNVVKLSKAGRQVLKVSEGGTADSKIVNTQAESNVAGGVAKEAGGGCLYIVTRIKLSEEA